MPHGQTTREGFAQPDKEEDNLALQCGRVMPHGETSISPPVGQAYLIMRTLCVLCPLAFVLVISLSVSDLFIFRQSSAPLLLRLGTWGKPQTCP